MVFWLLQDSCIPPSERCRYKTTKTATGPFNRKALLDFIEKKAREEKDWDEVKPFKKEVRGVLKFYLTI
jgi:tropomodulin